MTQVRQWLVVTLCTLLGVVLLASMLHLPEAPIQPPRQVAQHLDVSGVEHPVTAVLLNFRGYDTMLEVAVLLLALLGMLAAGVAPMRSASIKPDPVLIMLARALAPMMVMVAGYLLWAGAFRPGGAFQAGAVLAAAGVMLRLAGLLPVWTMPGLRMRYALVAGFMIFLLVAAGGLVAGAMLRYPPEWAGALILAVEAGLTVSLGLILAGLFLAGPEAPMEAGRR